MESIQIMFRLKILAQTSPTIKLDKYNIYNVPFYSSNGTLFIRIGSGFLRSSKFKNSDFFF